MILYLKNVIILLIIFCFSLPATAGLFGPSNFEECMSDGKIGRSTAEIFQLRKSCQKKFPKLLSIKNGTNAPIKCVFSGSTDVLNIQYNKKNNSVTINDIPKAVILYTDEKLVIGIGPKDPPLEINYLTGSVSLTNMYGQCSDPANN